MESSIKIDFRDDGKGLQPIIAVKILDSEDPRDKLLKTFFQALGGESSWLVVSFDHHIIQDVKSAKTFITIQPVRPSELKETSDIIINRISPVPVGGIHLQDPMNYNPIKDRYLPTS